MASTSKKLVQDFDPKTAVYTPPAAVAVTMQAIRQAHEVAEQGVPLGIDGLDGYWRPMLPGKLYIILGQTSNGKSLLVSHIERHNALDVLKRGTQKEEAVFHISVEDLIEEQVTAELARFTGDDPADMSIGKIQDMDKLRAAARQVEKMPVFRIGESLARPEAMPYLTVSNMIRCLKMICDGTLLPHYKPRPRLLVFDYLQAFPLDPEAFTQTDLDKQRRLQVRNDIMRVRQIAALFRCPALVAVQAKQRLEGANPPIMLPGMYDGEESSSIAQRADGMLSIWMPATTHTLGEIIARGDLSFKVAPNLMLIKVAKQRGKLPRGKTFFARINFEDYGIALERKEDT